MLSAVLSACGMTANALDLSLQQCREMALASDESMRIAENEVAGAVLGRKVAHTAYLPNLSGNATLAYMTPDTEFSGMKMQMKGLYMAGINLTQPIYAGGKIVAANRLAKDGELIAREQQRATRMDVLAEAEKSYWMYVAVLSKVEMMRNYLGMMDSIYETTSSSVEIGMTTRQNLLRVDARRSEVVYGLRQASAGADICRMALCRVIGVPDTVDIRPVEPLDFVAAADISLYGIDNRPELMMLSRNIDVKKHQVDLIRGDYLPTLGVQVGWSAFGNLKMKGFAQDETGNYVPYTSTTNTNSFMGVLSLSVPLFHWGEGVKKVRQAKLEVENARLSYERNRKLMNLESRQAYSNLLTGEGLIESAQKAFSESDENLRIMTEQYDVGLVTLTDLLEAQSQWHTSYSNLIEAKTQYRIYGVEYLRSVGKIE